MAKVLLVAIIASTALFFVVTPDYEEPEYDASSLPSPEAPWLSRSAAAQIVGPDGDLGPLFDGLWLGGPAPSREARARIARFARENRVQIDLEEVDNELAVIRFAVTYGGCCGYEGADVLAMRLRRPNTRACCVCSREWVDDWAVTNTGGTMRGRVRVNRVLVRWERTLTLSELLERADDALGKRAAEVGRDAGDRWREIEPGARYLLETPYPFIRSPELVAGSGFGHREDLGLMVRVEQGAIVEVSFVARDLDHHLMMDDLRRRWGSGHSQDDVPEVQTWVRSDRTVRAERSWSTKITIAKR